jgi:hypothetical protein
VTTERRQTIKEPRKSRLVHVQTHRILPVRAP